jgi:hypothetical protein
VGNFLPGLFLFDVWVFKSDSSSSEDSLLSSGTGLGFGGLPFGLGVSLVTEAIGVAFLGFLPLLLCFTTGSADESFISFSTFVLGDLSFSSSGDSSSLSGALTNAFFLPLLGLLISEAFFLPLFDFGEAGSSSLLSEF